MYLIAIQPPLPAGPLRGQQREWSKQKRLCEAVEYAFVPDFWHIVACRWIGQEALAHIWTPMYEACTSPGEAGAPCPNIYWSGKSPHYRSYSLCRYPDWPWKRWLSGPEARFPFSPLRFLTSRILLATRPGSEYFSLRFHYILVYI